MSSTEGTEGGPWLHAWFDPLSNLKTVTGCVRLADLNGDGENKLIICTLDKRMLIYRGTSLAHEVVLLEVPVALAVTYTDTTLPRMPAIAVAAGPYVFIYRQLRPYRKWSCPPIDISKTEKEIWTDLSINKIDDNKAVELLTAARESGISISPRSLDFLSLENTDRRASFLSDVKEASISTQLSPITCMEIMKKDNEAVDALSILIVGTEEGHVYFLPHDPIESNIVCKVKLSSAPVLLNVAGLFDVEWRVIVACRDGKIFNIRNGEVRGTAILSASIVDSGSLAVAMTKQDKNVVISFMDKLLGVYSVRGKRVSGMMLSDCVTEMCVIQSRRSSSVSGLLVAMQSGEIRLYRGTTVINSFKVEKPILAMRFGPYGREDNSLIIIHGLTGSMTIKILRRLFDMEGGSHRVGATAEQEIPLQIPKKTKLYVEQTQREREQAIQMHNAFQTDLCKLRLETARAYVKTLTDGSMGSSNSLAGTNIRVSVIVSGLGPKFILRISLQNAGTSPLLHSKLMFSYDSSLYRVTSIGGSHQTVSVPALLPGPKHVYEVEVFNIDAQGKSGQIILMLANVARGATSSSSTPLLSATVKMPQSELMV